jgi:hypothetical protein
MGIWLYITHMENHAGHQTLMDNINFKGLYYEIMKLILFELMNKK